MESPGVGQGSLLSCPDHHHDVDQYSNNDHEYWNQDRRKGDRTKYLRPYRNWLLRRHRVSSVLVFADHTMLTMTLYGKRSGRSSRRIWPVMIFIVVLLAVCALCALTVIVDFTNPDVLTH